MSGFSMDAAARQLADRLSRSEAAFGEKLKSLDMNNPGDMIVMQREMQKINMISQLSSTISKSFYEACRGILQKMN